MVATLQADGIITVDGPDMDGLSREQFRVSGYTDTEQGEYLAEVALIEHGLYRVGPWRDAEHGAIVCAVALLPDVGVRAEEVGSGESFTVRLRSWATEAPESVLSFLEGEAVHGATLKPGSRVRVAVHAGAWDMEVTE